MVTGQHDRLAHRDRLTDRDEQHREDPHAHCTLHLLVVGRTLDSSIYRRFLLLRTMRPFVSFFTFISFFLAAALVAARTETISSPDKRIRFEGPWQDVSIRVTWVARSVLIILIHPDRISWRYILLYQTG